MTKVVSQQPSIVADVNTAAEWISHALCEMGYLADFSLESLKEVDRFFEEHACGGQAVPNGLLSQDLGTRLFGLGAYIGEVIRRCRGGEWEGNDDDPAAEMNVALRLATDSVCWPIQRAMKRFRLGAEESVAAYGYALTRRDHPVRS